MFVGVIPGHRPLAIGFLVNVLLNRNQAVKVCDMRSAACLKFELLLGDVVPAACHTAPLEARVNEKYGHMSHASRGLAVPTAKLKLNYGHVVKRFDLLVMQTKLKTVENFLKVRPIRQRRSDVVEFL